MTGILAEGQLFLGKYRVERLIGRGGMGAVYAAMDIDLARKVAIKVLLPQIANSRTAATRFVNEGRAAARIEGNHVARVFAAGRTEQGLPYMVLELLEGTDLSDHLTQRGRLSVAEAVDIILEALEAVEEAHQHGIVHRDLKPGNIFLHRRSNGAQVVKVLDFGISKSSHPFSDTSGEQELTMTRALLGSPFYMSPEQLQDSKSVDRRTDIWSLGVILYEMLAGIVPFRGESLHDLFQAIVEQPVLPLGNLRPEVPAGLQAVIGRCLERDLGRRFGDASELSRALTPYGSRASASFGRPMNFAVPKVDYEVGTEDTVQKTQLWIPPQGGAMRPSPHTVTPSQGHSVPAANTMTPSRGYSAPTAHTVTPSHGHAAPTVQTHGAWTGTNPREQVGASIRRTKRAMLVLGIAVPAALIFLGSIFVFSLILGPKETRKQAVKTALSAASSSAAHALGAASHASTATPAPIADAAPASSASSASPVRAQP